MIYVEAEILRTGNKQLLDNLEEGVIIQEKDTHEIIFMNRSAKNNQKKLITANGNCTSVEPTIDISNN